MNLGGLRPVFFACLFGWFPAEKIVDQEVSETEENKEEARPELFRERGSVLKTHGVISVFLYQGLMKIPSSMGQYES